MKTFVAEAPSNIALVKYWGKEHSAEQWPANDSISMTLSKAKTITKARVLDSINDILFINGAESAVGSSHGAKARAQIARLREMLRREGLAAPSLEIDSVNTFPTACGIASSASGLMALTLVALGAWLDEPSIAQLSRHGYGPDRIKHLARLGSGSACRSLDSGFVRWKKGDSPTSQKVTSLFSAEHWPLSDVIVVLSSEEKKTSSTDGHRAAWTSPLFKPRLARLGERLLAAERAIATRDLETLGHEIELEALEMHAVMQSSSPRADFFAPETQPFLDWVRSERSRGRLRAFFTLDAGPNPHLLCEARDASGVAEAVRSHYPKAPVIVDHIGGGARLFAIPSTSPNLTLIDQPELTLS